MVHHSDRGVQYASGDYTKLLPQHGISISMSRKANPYDNAMAESFMKTLKYEEVYLFEYEDFAEAKRRVGQFLDRVYNEKRLHSALGYLPPVEYEQSVLEQARACLALPCMLFGNEPPPRGESSRWRGSYAALRPCG